MFEQTGGMFPELITRSDINVFLPPIGGQTVYIFGDPDYLRDESKVPLPSAPMHALIHEIALRGCHSHREMRRVFARTEHPLTPEQVCTVRVHDECNGSDVFGSDICTCRPYLVHGIEECVRTAQEGGVGVIVYFRKEGRSLGEVTKFLVYNARKRQEGGDRAETYFHRTACVAGVEDMRFQVPAFPLPLVCGLLARDSLACISLACNLPACLGFGPLALTAWFSRFQELMPDALHWLGVTKVCAACASCSVLRVMCFACCTLRAEPLP
jgi:GTP cyclohydrolase II